MDRPAQFSLNHGHPLAQGMVFAGLGRHPDSTYYHDSSHYCNHGLLTTMAVPATATSGWARDGYLGRWVMTFDGYSDYVDCGASLVIKPTGAMSMAGWFNGSQQDPGYSTGFGTLGNSGSRGYMLGMAATTSYPIAYIPSSSTALYSATGATSVANILVHLASVFVPSKGLYIYANGGLVGSNTSSPPASQYQNANSLKIGTRGDTSGYLRGWMSDPMMWDRELAAAEIAALADPSNTMLSGMLQYKRRRSFGFFAAAASGFKPAWAARRQRAVGTGVI
jgi:hypothetical protein